MPLIPSFKMLVIFREFPVTAKFQKDFRIWQRFETGVRLAQRLTSRQRLYTGEYI